MEYVVTSDERGRIVLPAEVRQRLGIKASVKSCSELERITS